MRTVEATQFFGTFTPKLDEKGRIFLPAKFRAQLHEGVVLAKGQENCVYGWKPETFAELTQKLRASSFANKKVRYFQRVLYASASTEVPDKQGRIAIPALLREWASLERECAVIGAMDRIEIWDAERWAAFTAEQDEAFADLGDEEMPDLF
ncbi:MAG: division/cell wall cluster transcriptional repressor MraZ [Aeromicrobium sp.]|uniref:division/cell wall cluster transcriptional repressor MraZ n=1 Tax=Aeromicrobium sp. TaxID=1871063 RepID=UPI0039E67C65